MWTLKINKLTKRTESRPVIARDGGGLQGQEKSFDQESHIVADKLNKARDYNGQHVFCSNKIMLHIFKLLRVDFESSHHRKY